MIELPSSPRVWGSLRAFSRMAAVRVTDEIEEHPSVRVPISEGALA